MHSNEENTNNEIERGIDGIYLRPNNNIQGRHRVINLNMGQVITRNIVQPIPLPAAVKEKVEEMAVMQGLTSTKYYNQKGIELPNIEDSRGVEYVDVYDYDPYDKDYTKSTDRC